MRAHGRKYEMGGRFAIVIGLAATGVMALGAQTGAAASEDVVEYDTKVSINTPRNAGFFYGSVESEVWKCVVGREVIVFRKRPGPDLKLATRILARGSFGDWKVRAPWRGRVYAKVAREVGDGSPRWDGGRAFVCRADYSHVIRNGGS